MLAIDFKKTKTDKIYNEAIETSLNESENAVTSFEISIQFKMQVGIDLWLGNTTFFLKAQLKHYLGDISTGKCSCFFTLRNIFHPLQQKKILIGCQRSVLRHYGDQNQPVSPA